MFILQKATSADIPLLAQMNQHLIQDEGSSNPMSLAELETRMAEFIAERYTAILIHLEGQIIGYALYCALKHVPPRPEDGIFVRHFFIRREFRQQGWGKIAFEQIVRTYFPHSPVTLEVLAHNEAGKALWQSLGFQMQAITLLRMPTKEANPLIIE